MTPEEFKELSSETHDEAGRRTQPLVAGAPGTSVPGQWSWLTFGMAFVVLAMVIGFSVFVVRLMGTIDEQNRQLLQVENKNGELRTQLVALQDELRRKEEMLNVLAAKDVEIAVMKGLDVHPAGYGKIIWDPARKRAILQVSNLPMTPPDKDYQLWVMKGKQPISAGVFAVRDTESNYFSIENPAMTDPREIAAFAVTLEPKGGMLHPTGARYMAGAPRL